MSNRPVLMILSAVAAAHSQPGWTQQTVTPDNFIRAETDHYFSDFVRGGEFGKLVHLRELADVHKQVVVRTNRDTLYSRGVFDLDAGPVTITLPDSRGRFMSLLLINEDHYNPATIYEPGSHTITRDEVGTRYVALLVRTFVDPNDKADLNKAHALQDAIKVKQPGGPGKFEIPLWDKSSLDKTRADLNKIQGVDFSKAFGKPGEVDPRAHLLGTAGGWGGNPQRDAAYISASPAANDGKTIYRLTVKDVPVDGFWSITVYNKDGFMEPNPQDAYSLNNVTARQGADGAYTIQFGGCDGKVLNCLPITPGWNYTVRLYRPRKPLLDGSWKFPEAVPVDWAP